MTAGPVHPDLVLQPGASQASATPSGLVQLNQQVVACTRCPRLVAYLQKIGREKRRAYLSWEYWAKPVTGFRHPRARLLILGLAPRAHGSNRTLRPLTYDLSGNFLSLVLPH